MTPSPPDTLTLMVKKYTNRMAPGQTLRVFLGLAAHAPGGFVKRRYLKRPGGGWLCPNGTGLVGAALTVTITYP